MTPQLFKPQSRLHQIGGTAGMVGPALFAIVFILQNVLRTDDDAIAEPVSALSIGDYGWIQQLNFVVFGVLLLVFAAALHRGVASSRLGWIGPALLSVAGAGLLVAATFSLARDETGAIYDPSFHQVGGMMFFGGTALGFIALSRRFARDPEWQRLSRYTLGAGIASIVGGVVINALAIPADAPLHGGVGLIQRFIVLAIIFPTLITLGHRLRGLAKASLNEPYVLAATRREQLHRGAWTRRSSRRSSSRRPADGRGAAYAAERPPRKGRAQGRILRLPIPASAAAHHPSGSA